MHPGTMLVCLLALSACAHPVRQQRAEMTSTDYLVEPLVEADRSAAVDVLQRLKTAIRADDPGSIAVNVNYPFFANGVAIRNSSEFVSQYPNVFTQKLRASILAMSPDRLENTSEGFVFGSGEVWIALCSAHTSAGRCPGEAKLLITGVNDKR